MWNVAKYGDPYSEFVLYIYPIQSAHCSAVNTHPEQWVDSAAAPGEQLGVQCLAQGSHLSRGIEGGENAHRSLPPPTIPAKPEIWTHNLRLQVRHSIH